jgi:D-alanyl-D-alanine carboxypeptidase
VEQWLPGVVTGNGNDGRLITVRQLLQHTSGIHDDLPGFADHEDYLEHRYDTYTPEQIIERAMAHEPDFAPGTGWGYCNTCYVMLTLIIEEITGAPWDQAVEEGVLQPLGMDDTYLPGDDPTIRSPHARSYEYYPADVNRFFQGLLGGELLSEAMLAEMQDTVPVSEAFQVYWPDAGYGLGLMSRPLSCGGVYWSHEGGDTGYITLNGATVDGSRAVTVSMTTALADTPEHFLLQEETASALVDHALCDTPGAEQGM